MYTGIYQRHVIHTHRHTHTQTHTQTQTQTHTQTHTHTHTHTRTRPAQRPLQGDCSQSIWGWHACLAESKCCSVSSSVDTSSSGCSVATAVYVRARTRARARLCLCVCTCTTCSLSRIPNTCSHKSLSLSQGFSHARERGCPPHHPTCTPTHMHTRTHAHTSSALANFLFIQRLCRLLHALRLGNDGLLIYSDM